MNLKYEPASCSVTRSCTALANKHLYNFILFRLHGVLNTLWHIIMRLSILKWIGTIGDLKNS